ncbi:MAG TPA: tetratricopeptide repeat protein [Nitrospirota bacterium]|nr:tetratricopeptide repeat protein [Nitrospirota bacterium]
MSKRLLALILLALVFPAVPGCSGGGKETQALVDEAAGLMKQNKHQEALARLDKAVKADPKDAKAHFYRGNALSILGSKDEAIKEYDLAIKYAPDIPQPYYNKGNALANLEKSEEAVAAYDQAIARDPAYVKAYYNKALLLDRLGRKDEAREVFDKANALSGAGAAMGGATSARK